MLRGRRRPSRPGAGCPNKTPVPDRAEIERPLRRVGYGLCRIVPACFEQQDVRVPILCQSSRDDGAAGSCAADDEVENIANPARILGCILLMSIQLHVTTSVNGFRLNFESGGEARTNSRSQSSGRLHAILVLRRLIQRTLFVVIGTVGTVPMTRHQSLLLRRDGFGGLVNGIGDDLRLRHEQGVACGNPGDLRLDALRPCGSAWPDRKPYLLWR